MSRAYDNWIYEQLEPDTQTHVNYHRQLSEREHRAALDREMLEKYGPEELQRREREWQEYITWKNKDNE